MWSYHAYRWPDQAAWLAALAAAGWAGGTPPEVELLVAGAIYAPAPDGETPDALPGWHVAAAFRAPAAPPEAWAALEIDPPAGMPVLGRAAAPGLADYEAAIQAHIDATAGERGYASGVSCASYVASTVPAFAAEAAAFIAWRDAVWISVHAQLAAVQSGAPAPSVRGLIAALPAMEWPA